MDTVNLDVQMRDTSVKGKILLSQNLIPIEYYGKGVENKSFQVDYQTFRRTYEKTGRNTIIDLIVEGEKEPFSVLVHEVSYDPVTDQITHVDVMNVEMGKELQTQIPLEFVGVAPAVKELAGMLMTHLNEVSIKCLPRHLIHSIEVDLSGLIDFNEYIRVKDLNVPETITVLNELEDVVVTVVPQRQEEEEPEVVEGEEGAEGEEEKEGEGGEEKKDEGGEDGEKNE